MKILRFFYPKNEQNRNSDIRQNDKDDNILDGNDIGVFGYTLQYKTRVGFIDSRKEAKFKTCDEAVVRQLDNDVLNKYIKKSTNTIIFIYPDEKLSHVEIILKKAVELIEGCSV